MLTSSPVASPRKAVLSVFEGIVRKRGRECPRCGGRHRDAQFKMCSPCRDLTAAYHKAYRHDHIARRLCPECVQKKGKVTKVCEYHRTYNNEKCVKRAADQRAKGLCTWGRCPNQADAGYCDEHRAIHAAHAARRAKRAKRAWRLSA